MITPTSAPAQLDEARVTVGIGQFSTDAVALGATAMPDPDDEPGFPWLYQMSHPFFYNSTSVVDAQAGLSVRRTIDIRSMRKIKPRESIGWVTQYVDVTGAPPLQIVVGKMRVLVGLH